MTDKDKFIYTLPDGSRNYDPLVLRRRLLLQSKGKLNEWIALYNDAVEEADRLVAEEGLVAAARFAFELRPVSEGGGITDAVVLEYLSHFLEWLSVPVSLTTAPSPIDQPCLDCLPPDWTTERRSVSNSTPSGLR